jgi:transcriptional regulator with XRE-family HTH domain
MTQVKNERIRRSMSQKRLALLAGIDARTLRKIEKGEYVSLESYRAVCNALGIEPVGQDRDTEFAGEAPITVKSRSPFSGWLIAAFAFVAVALFGSGVIYYVDAQRFMNLGPNLLVTWNFVGILLFLLGCPLVSFAVIWGSPNTVVTLFAQHDDQEKSVSSIMETVHSIAPDGKFKVESVKSTGTGQSVIAMGFADTDDYSKLARLLTARGFQAEVHPA